MSVSQPARYGEDWSDERVKGYLNHIAPEGDNADFHVLMVAYKQMRAYDFERFVTFFKEAGRDLNAQGADGKTLLKIAQSHAKSADFVKILEAAQG
jgi:hypothetical protein